MKITNYLTFDGEGASALDFYARLFNGEIKTATRYSEAPFDVPSGYTNRLMYGELEFETLQLLISDIAPGRYDLQAGNNVALMLTDTDQAKMNKIFEALSTEGTVVEPLESTFWGTIFGMVIDQFGVVWKVNILTTSDDSVRSTS